MIRLVNQFDPPQRRASVATATCCSCCCCCCCLISAVGTTTFTASNLTATARKRGQSSATGQAIGAGFALCLFLPVIGAAIALGSLSSSSGGGNVVLFSLILFTILGGILTALYASAHEPHPALAGFGIAGVGSAIAIGEAFLVLYGLLGPAGGGILVVYLLLLLGGIWLAAYLGPRVDWTW